MQIAVVIPALDEAERIRDTIESARASDVEIVVVDGGSRDATAQCARQAGARVISCEPGRARQLAAGVAGSSGEALLLLHADTRLPPGWAACVRSALADPAVAGGAFGFRFEGSRGPRLRFIEWGVALRLALARLPYGDQAIFLRRRVLEAMGGVPQVPIMEDLDLVRGIRAAGRLALCPEPVRTSPRRYLEQGVLRTWLRHSAALVAWRLGVERGRIAGWLRR